MEQKLARIKELIDQKEAIDGELSELIGGGEMKRKTIRCGHCGAEGHSARSCPQKMETQTLG